MAQKRQLAISGARKLSQVPALEELSKSAGSWLFRVSAESPLIGG
jgi:hypothetical protein